MGDMGVGDQCGLLNTCFHNVLYSLIFDKFTIVVVSLHTTNQSADLEAFLSLRTINVSMPHGGVQ
jgi:hypothetical protein